MTSDPYFWIVVLAIALAIAVGLARSFWRTMETERANSRKKDEQLSVLRETHAKQLAAVDTQYKKLIDHMRGMDKIFEQRKVQFPWLATAIADFHAMESERDAQTLETKKHPAIRSAAQVREHGTKKREAERLARLMRYRVEYYENLFPWLADYVGDDVPDFAVEASEARDTNSDDPVKAWLTDAEYQKLSTLEKNQMALDRWKASSRRKSNWEIGRDYERFIGYTYETLGYDVTFTGAIQGFEDMGRDLIARRGSELRVIQCKYWRQGKTIHEKHIFQLFGSALEYAFRLGTFNDLKQLSFFGGPIKATGATAVLYTSAKISDVAKDAATKLNVECHENIGISDYPLVKCNISMRDGEKIYHLPFDQQYDARRFCPIGARNMFTQSGKQNRQAFVARGDGVRNKAAVNPRHH